MTLRSRLALLSPVWALAINRSRAAARLAAEVRTLQHDLAVTRADRDALAAHYRLAIAQRNTARDLAVAVVGEPGVGPTDAEYDDWLRSLGERPA